MKALIFFIMMCCISRVSAQTTAEDSVKQVINKLFTAMKSVDGALLQTCFADSAILQTIAKNKEGKLQVRNEAVAEFVRSVSAAKKEALDERIVFAVVKIDGPLAIAWTPYSFYYDGKFSHCGVNSFQLVRTDAGWKIQYLIDTRRRNGCSQ